MKIIKIHFIVGARPNYIKLAPLIDKFIKSRKYKVKIINTGQHFDRKMTNIFFKNFNFNKKVINLSANRNNQIYTISAIQNKYNALIDKDKPNHVIVFGDVNSTFAVSFVAQRNNITISHIEAGLRSFDKRMPEEINRILTDHLSDNLFVHSKEAIQNLRNENISLKKIYFVGNIIIDTYFKYKKEILRSKIIEKNKLNKKKYILITIHRPSNTDNKNQLETIIEQINKFNKKYEIVLIKHPRIVNKNNFFYKKLNKIIKILEPQDYFNFTKLLINSKLIITDSGGVQEESAFHNIKCLILRKNTERNIVLRKNNNILVENNKIFEEAERIINLKDTKPKKIKFWDKKVSSRIFKIINESS